MFYTGDPERDFRRWDVEQEAARELLPNCDDCGKRVEDDFCYQFNDTIICEECLERNYKKLTTDLMG